MQRNKKQSTNHRNPEKIAKLEISNSRQILPKILYICIIFNQVEDPYQWI